jgi:hypothetical protein
MKRKKLETICAVIYRISKLVTVRRVNEGLQAKASM